MDSCRSLLFWILAALTGVCAIAVVVTQNIVRAATWLLFTLAGISGLFFLLGADFVGATQLLVYVGGTLVLVVFGVMLTAQGPFINMKTGAAEWAIAIARRPAVLYGVLAVSPGHQPDRRSGSSRGQAAATAAAMPPTAPVLGEALLGVEARHRRRRIRRPACRRRSRPSNAHADALICCRLKSSRCICWWC